MSDEKKPELTPQQKEWARIATLATGDPARYGYSKCSRCGAQRAAGKLKDGACEEGCAPVSAENDTRRALRLGRGPNDAVEWPVDGAVATAAASSSLKPFSERCLVEGCPRELVPTRFYCAAHAEEVDRTGRHPRLTLDPELCS